MTKIIYIFSDGERRSIDASGEASIMEVAYKNDIPGIVAECGGACACATCHVYVDERFLDMFPPADQFEADMLEGVSAERRPNSRLSCQLKVTTDIDGIEIEVPESSS